EHEACIEKADEGSAAASELGDHGPVNEPSQLFHIVVGHDRYARIPAHAAGIPPPVSVREPLEILRGWKRDDLLPVAKREERDLLPLEKLLDDDLPPELARAHDGRDS